MASLSRGLKNADLERWLVFAFGVIFTSVLLYLATVVKNPEPFAIKVYATVLALAAAGVGALLPGFMELRYKGFFRASGAMALGAVVYLNEPAIGRSVPTFVRPNVSPIPIAENYLSAVDAKEMERAWSMLPDFARRHVGGDRDAFEQLYKRTVEPLGAPTKRDLVGQADFESPPGAPPGYYHALTYKTLFSAGNKARPEMVVVRANADGGWEIYSHQVSLASLPD